MVQFSYAAPAKTENIIVNCSQCGMFLGDVLSQFVDVDQILSKTYNNVTREQFCKIQKCEEYVRVLCSELT